MKFDYSDRDDVCGYLVKQYRKGWWAFVVHDCGHVAPVHSSGQDMYAYDRAKELCDDCRD